MMKNKIKLTQKIFFRLANLIFGVFIFLSCSAIQVLAQEDSDGLLAVVNNEVITQKDLDNFIKFMRLQLSDGHSEQEIEQRIDQMRPDLIIRLIEERLILQAAYKEDISVDQKRIKAKIQQIRNNFPNEASFQNSLITQGLTLADLELKIKEQLLTMEIIDKKIRSRIIVTPQELTDYYHTHREELLRPEQRLVKLIIVKDADLIRKIRRSLRKYNSLEGIAQDYSLEIIDLDWITAEQLKKDIADKVFDSQVGSLSQHLSSPDELYIFEVQEIRSQGKMSLFEAQAAIKRFIFEKRMQEALNNWLEELKAESYIEIKDYAKID